MAGRPNIKQFAPCQSEQNKAAGDLKVCIGNSKRIENNLPKKTNPIATQNAVKSPRPAWRLRCSGEALDASPMNIATSPIGSMATKTGMKATKNFWIILTQISVVGFGPQMNTDQAPIHQNSCATPASICTNLRLIALLLVFLECEISAAELKNIDAYQAAAAKAKRVLTIPDWEKTPDALTASIMEAIAKGNAALDQIGSQNLEDVTFESSLAALENLRADVSAVANRAATISETNPDPLMRAAAQSALKKFQEWNVGIDYREDVFKAIKTFAAKKPDLIGEDKRLLSDTLRDFRRAGMDLPAEKRKEIELLRRKLSTLATEFEANILAAKAPVVFAKEELDGLSDNFLSSPGIKIDNNRYQVMADSMWQYNTVEENARAARRAKNFTSRTIRWLKRKMFRS